MHGTLIVCKQCKFRKETFRNPIRIAIDITYSLKTHNKSKQGHSIYMKNHLKSPDFYQEKKKRKLPHLNSLSTKHRP